MLPDADAPLRRASRPESDVAQARDTFRKAGCQLGTIVHQPSTKFKKFRIKAQTSRTGATVPAGTKINITVAWGAHLTLKK